jgi:F-type H+-transporting ATPase subunit delta
MAKALLTTPRRFEKLPTYDTAELRAARTYAEALINATEGSGQSDAVMAEFESFISDVLDKLPKLEAVLASAFIGEDAKLGLLDRALSGKAAPVFLNFLKVVARHDRLNMIRIIHLAARDLVVQRRGQVRVLVNSAAPLDTAAEHRILDSIRTRLKVEPILEKQVNPDLIGGIVLRVGDRVFDGSIATSLAQIREQLIHRSIHEIQSGRDRFGLAEGN